MGLFHNHFKLKMSKSQTNYVAFKSAPSPETCISHYSLVPKPGGGKRKLRQTGEDIPSTKGLWSSFPWLEFADVARSGFPLQTTIPYFYVQLMTLNYWAELNTDSSHCF